MDDEKADPTGGESDEQPRRDSAVGRRSYLKLAGLTAAAASGTSLLPAVGGAITGGGPPNPDNWTVRVSDDFEQGSLDTSIWNVGWGWGTSTTQGSMYTDERAITFGDSTVELAILNEPDLYPVGAINTKDKVTIGPGTYVEARTRCSDLPGTTSNFWSKPNSEAWPPEIDFKETPIRDDGDSYESMHHIHWTTDGQPNGPHADYSAGRHNGGYDKSQNWTVYGCRWLQDSVTYYINGSLDMQGNPTVSVDSAGRNVFYVNGGFLDGSGGDGNPTIEAIVYAPNADVVTKGNPTLRGAFVTKSLSTGGNAKVEYDDSLKGREIRITGGSGQNPITYLHVSENVVEVDFDR